MQVPESPVQGEQSGTNIVHNATDMRRSDQAH